MIDEVPVDYVLFKLNEMFRIVYISSPLVTGKDIEDAKNIHRKYDFDRVPIKKNGQILSYYDSSTDSEKKIEINEILPESTGILETLSYLSKREFYFILSGNQLTHIVHYSDLNKQLILVPIYAEIEYCEISIRDLCKSKNICDTLIKKLINASKKRRSKKRSSVDELYFDEELILFRELVKPEIYPDKLKNSKGLVNLDDEMIKEFVELRNRIMHAKTGIINEHNDVKKLLNFLQTCQYIIKIINQQKSVPLMNEQEK
ncbi:MAG: hypothetical protein QW578_07705 [Thermoplasmatales archaeon]